MISRAESSPGAFTRFSPTRRKRASIPTMREIVQRPAAAQSVRDRRPRRRFARSCSSIATISHVGIADDLRSSRYATAIRSAKRRISALRQFRQIPNVRPTRQSEFRKSTRRTAVRSSSKTAFSTQGGNRLPSSTSREPLDALNGRSPEPARRSCVVLAVGRARGRRSSRSCSRRKRSIRSTSCRDAMREIRSDRLDRRLRWPHRNDEIGDARARASTICSRVSQEAFARERQFISDASHELKTPLTSINANAQMLLRWGDQDPEDSRESLETIANESATSQHGQRHVDAGKGRPRRRNPKEPRIAARTSSTKRSRNAHRARRRSNSISTFDARRAIADRSTATRICCANSSANLIDNAIKFTERAGSTYRRQRPNARWVEVADTGPGIPEEDSPRFSTDSTGPTRRVRATFPDRPGPCHRPLHRARPRREGHGRARQQGGALFRVTFPQMALAFTGLS